MATRCLGIVGAVGFLIALSAASALGGEIGKQRPEGKPISLLGGRLLAVMPRGAKPEPRGPGNIMGAAPSTESETRVVLDVGPERIVLMASETYCTAGDDFETKVRDEAAKWGKEAKTTFAVEPIRPAGPAGRLTILSIVNTGKAERSDAISIRNAYVLLPDKTVVSVDLYANPKAYEDSEGCDALAKAVLAKLSAGDGKLPTAAGAKHIPVGSREPQLEVTTPDGFVLTCDEGIDFFVWRLARIRAFGNSRTGQIGLYIGGAPNPIHERREEQFGKITESKGKLLGQDVTWYSWVAKSDGEDMLGTEAIVKAAVPGEEEAMSVHMFAAARDARELDELRKIIESLRVVPVSTPASNTSSSPVRP